MSVWSCLVARALAVLIALFSLAACIGPHEDCALMACRQRPVGPLTVFAAASLQPAFDKISAQLHVDTTFNYAGTQTLPTQLGQGADAHVYSSADKTHINILLDAAIIA